MPKRKPLESNTERGKRQSQRRAEPYPARMRRLEKQRLIQQNVRRLQKLKKLKAANAKQLKQQAAKEEKVKSAERERASSKNQPPSYLQRTATYIHKTRQKDKLPFSYGDAKILYKDSQFGPPLSIGQMVEHCNFCQAKLFHGECSKDESGNVCCHKGKVTMRGYEVCEELQKLLEANNDLTENYLENIREYNNALAFASIQVQLPAEGEFWFKVHGQYYHRANSLQSSPYDTPKYAGLFLVDSEQATTLNMNDRVNRHCNKSMMEMLQNMLASKNPYAQSFQSIHSVAGDVPDLSLTLTTVSSFEQRLYQPRIGEIAAVFIADNGAHPGHFDLEVYSNETNALNKISYQNVHCDNMCYPLLFPCGDAGWKMGMPHINIHSVSIGRKFTQLQYYSYRLAIRGDFSLLHASGRLFQQYVVDSYVKVEGSRIAYIISHQKELKAEVSQGLVDFFHPDALKGGVIQAPSLVLPTYFLGSPRNMLQNYQDAMSLVTKFGKPDIFLTFRCNPKWSEISAELKPYEKAEQRPDLLSRVFYLKLMSLIDDVSQKFIFGVVVAFVYVIEFQTGLPQAHLLITLREEDKLPSADHIDTVVCAEIPDETANPRLFKIVKDFMVHGPCGKFNPQSVCMKEKRCLEGFPKEFNEETDVNVNGYPLYRRRPDKILRFGDNFLDNSWIVPYNKYLVLKYEAHIKVEIGTCVKSVEILYKCIYENHDWASVRLRNNVDCKQGAVNELDLYLHGRYINPSDAVWRLHGRPLFNKSHETVRLPVHLPGEQLEYFETDSLQYNQRRAKNTKLTAFFRLCQLSKHKFAKPALHLLYSELPLHYTWISNEWRTRESTAKLIGRIYTIDPADCERNALRALLLHVRGPTSYEDLRTVSGTLCSSFVEAAEKLHLVESDREWHNCLTEAAAYHTPKQLRSVFGIICLYGTKVDVPQLWSAFKHSLSDDFSRSYDSRRSTNLALASIQLILAEHGRCLEDFGLSCPCIEIPHEKEDGRDEDSKIGARAYIQLNDQQRVVVIEVLQSLKSKTPLSLFVEGPSGTGKTFLFNSLCQIFREKGKIVLPVAWTGVSAKLLSGGRTARTIFRLPDPILKNSVSLLNPASKDADLIRKCTVIIWDDISVVPKHALQVVDRLLRSIMNVDLPYGGKVIVFGGDFRSILPTVKNGNKRAILNEVVKESPLWKDIRTRKLVVNMRIQDPALSTWLELVGEGSLHSESHVSPTAVQVTRKVYCCDLIPKIYNIDSFSDKNIEKIANSAILCPDKEACQVSNNALLKGLVRGHERIFYSADSVQCPGEVDRQLYPVEFLNSLTPSDLPPHKLILKKNAIVMLVKDLSLEEGLAEGERMVITKMGDFTLKAKILRSGKTVLIPRISLTSSDSKLPFILSRRQFPVTLAFVIPIEKVLGQTLERVGLYLPQPVFAHGQFYVACSRATAMDKLFISILETESQTINEFCMYTSNIVYKEVL